MTEPEENQLSEVLKKDLKDRDLTYDEYLGGGAFGKVFKAKHDIDKKTYAIKVIKINECYKDSTQSLHEIISKTTKETELLAGLSHSNVTSYHDSWFGGPGAQQYKDLKEDDSRPENQEVGSSALPRRDIPEFWLCIKMGFCQSNLRRSLEQNKTIELRLSNLEIVCKEILSALEYIHRQGVIHRDVKPENILIQKEQPLSIQIGDFGLSIKDNQESSHAGTLVYRSPEMLQRRYYDSKTDVFSVGLVIFEFISVSIDNKDERGSSFDEIREGRYNFPSESPIPINNLIKKMTMRGIGKGERPSAKEALRDFYKIFPHLRVINCDSDSKENESGQDIQMEDGFVDDSPRPSTSHSSHYGKERILNSRKRKNCTELINPDEKKPMKNVSLISHEIYLPAYNFQGRHEEIQKLLQFFSKENPKYTDRTILINGLGGVGKTELCKKFLNEIKDNASRIWLHGETLETIASSVKWFQTQNPDLFKNPSKSQQSSSQLFDALCKKCLEKSNRLVVVIDNVDVKHEVPTEIINLVMTHQNLYILVTSRNKDLFGGYTGPTIKLEMLSNNEAKQLLEDSLKGLDVCESEQTKLCKLVGNFPLALQQAVAYIKMQKKKRWFKISDYAEKLESILEQKLNNIDHNYKNTTEGTFQATWDLMSEDAKEVLKVVAHLNPDEIVVDSLKVICSFFKLNDEGVDEALEMIINYSLVTSTSKQDRWQRETQEHLIVHRLVQKFLTKQFNAEYSKDLCKLFLSLDNDTFSQLNEKLISAFLLDLKRIFCLAYGIKIEIENSILSQSWCGWKDPFDDEESFHICRYTNSDLTRQEYLLLLVNRMIGNSLIKHNLPNEGLHFLEPVLYSGVDNLEELAFNQILSIKGIDYIEHINESKNPSELGVGVKIRLAHEYENLGNFDRSSQLFNEVRELLPLLMSEFNLMSEDSKSEDFQSDMDDNYDYTATRESVDRERELYGPDSCGLRSDISRHMITFTVENWGNEGWETNPDAILNKRKDLHKRISLVTCDWTTVSRKEILCQFRDFKYEKLKSAELRRILKYYKDKLGEEHPLTIKVKYALAFRLYWNRSDAVGKNTISSGHKYISEYNYDTRLIYKEPEWYHEFKKDADNPVNQTTSQMYEESIVLLKEVMDSGVDIEFWKVCDLIYHIGISYHRDENYEAAVELLEKALNYCRNNSVFDRIQIQLKMVLAGTYEKLSDWENALDSYSSCSNDFNENVRGQISRIKWKSGAMRNMTADDIRKEFSYHSVYYFHFYEKMQIKELKEALEFLKTTVGDSEKITVALKTHLVWKVSDDEVMLAYKLLMEIFDSQFTDLHEQAASDILMVCRLLKKYGKYIEEGELLEKGFNCEGVLRAGYFDLCDIEKRFPDLYTKFGKKLKACSSTQGSEGSSLVSTTGSVEDE